MTLMLVGKVHRPRGRVLLRAVPLLPPGYGAVLDAGPDHGRHDKEPYDM